MKGLAWVFQYAKRYRLSLVLTVASMLVLVGVQLVAPWIVRTMVAAVTDPGAGPEALMCPGQVLVWMCPPSAEITLIRGKVLYTTLWL